MRKVLRLRKWVIILLCLVNTLITLFMIMLNDFDRGGILIIFGLLITYLFNNYLLFNFTDIDRKMNGDIK